MDWEDDEGLELELVSSQSEHTTDEGLVSEVGIDLH